MRLTAVIISVVLGTTACSSDARRAPPAKTAPKVPFAPDVEPSQDGLPDSVAMFLSERYAPGSAEKAAAINTAQRAKDLEAAVVDNDDPADDAAAKAAYLSALLCFSARTGDAYAADVEALFSVTADDLESYRRHNMAEASFSGDVLEIPDDAERLKHCGAPTTMFQLLREPNATPACTQPRHAKIGVVFFNGMFTDVGVALAHRDLLRNKMKADGLVPEGDAAGERMAFHLAYNRNEFVIWQFAQVAAQKVLDIGHAPVGFLNRMLRVLGFRDESGNHHAELAPIAPMIQELVDEDLQRMVSDMRTRLSKDQKLLFVSHSQGNFYSNATSRLLDQAQRANVRQVMIATPTNSIEDGSKRWTTFDNDLIMSLISWARLPRLESQPIRAKLSEDWLGHAFDTAYMSNVGSLPRITGHLSEALKELPTAQTGVVDAKVRATLSWSDGTAKDFVLHVWEGDVHLYNKEDRGGDVGNLGPIVDEVDGQPWDRYESTCPVSSTMELRFGAHYYAGEGTGSATLRVEVGPEVKEYPVSFVEADGSVGLLQPRMVAKVVVALDPSSQTWKVSIVDL